MPRRTGTRTRISSALRSPPAGPVLEPAFPSWAPSRGRGLELGALLGEAAVVVVVAAAVASKSARSPVPLASVRCAAWTAVAAAAAVAAALKELELVVVA